MGHPYEDLIIEPLGASGRFYTYLHHRKDTGGLFYVGKGANQPRRKRFDRALERRGRSEYWSRVVAKSGGFRATVTAFFDLEREAHAEEVRLIALHGRHAKGGPLVNHTDGGEGFARYEIKPARRKALSDWGKLPENLDRLKLARAMNTRSFSNPEYRRRAHEMYAACPKRLARVEAAALKEAERKRLIPIQAAARILKQKEQAMTPEELKAKQKVPRCFRWNRGI